MLVAKTLLSLARPPSEKCSLNEPMIHVQIQEPNLDFQPLLIEEANDNIEDEASNEEQEDNHDEAPV